MSPIELRIKTVTACFCQRNTNQPEFRPTSIRGQLRRWHHILDLPSDHLTQLYGDASSSDQDGGKPSRVIVRVPAESWTITDFDLLPHKRLEPGTGNPVKRKALPPNSSFTLRMSYRPGTLSEEHYQSLLSSLKGWLLLGCLGQRQNRAAGSLWPEDLPQAASLIGSFPSTETEFNLVAQSLLSRSGHHAALLSPKYQDPERARADCSNTVNGQWEALGGINPRQPSPLRFKVIPLEGVFRILAIWDRQEGQDLDRAIKSLGQRQKPIAKPLQDVYSELTGEPLS